VQETAQGLLWCTGQLVHVVQQQVQQHWQQQDDDDDENASHAAAPMLAERQPSVQEMLSL